MCNLYSITTNQAAIIALFRVVNRTSATLRRCRACFRIIRLRWSATPTTARVDYDALGMAAALGTRQSPPIVMEGFKPQKIR
jgi:hypothetical protein